MTSRYGKFTVIAGLLALAALAGCRDHEQGRPLHYTKGAYQGAPDTGLSGETLDALRLRAQRQSYN